MVSLPAVEPRASRATTASSIPQPAFWAPMAKSQQLVTEAPGWDRDFRTMTMLESAAELRASPPTTTEFSTPQRASSVPTAKFTLVTTAVSLHALREAFLD